MLTKKQEAADQMFDVLKDVFRMMRFDADDRQATKIVGDDDCTLGQRIEKVLAVAGDDFADMQDDAA